MTTNQIGSGNGTYTCDAGGYFQGTEGQGTAPKINFTGELEVSPSCANGAYSVFRINGAWYNPDGGFHSCGSPYFAVRDPLIYCSIKTLPEGEHVSPGRLHTCTNGKVTGSEGQGTIITILFSGTLELIPICDNAAFDGLRINGAWHNPFGTFRDCGSPTFALTNTVVTCGPKTECACCNELLTMARSISL